MTEWGEIESHGAPATPGLLPALFAPFSFTQAAESVSRKGCLGTRWWGLQACGGKVDDGGDDFEADGCGGGGSRALLLCSF